MEAADFSGYATKAGLRCADGRIINPDAFKHMDGVKVPLVWQHGHGEPANILGHAVLEAREDGVYAYGFFNDTPAAQNAKRLVKHGDITNLSIYANQLVERAKQVLHGIIREVSLVLAGANPGALIDNVSIAHGDGDYETLDDTAIIHTGLPLEAELPEGGKMQDKAEKPSLEELADKMQHSADDPTVQEVFDSLTDEQKDVVHFMIGEALKAATATHSGTESDADEDLQHKDKEGTQDMGRNVFENGAKDQEGGELKHTLTRDDVRSIVANAQKMGSLKHAVEAYALEHGINDIDLLFPDAKSVTNTPEWDKRRTEWVAGVMSGTRHTPFSRIKSRSADITQAEARAKGYIKGTLKKEEFFGLTQRVTTPTTIYKKQKLDRDDLIDITDFDVVAWLKGEMRLMLEEEIARAILIGDGRAADDEDKVKDGSVSGVGIRPIALDDPLYVTTVNVNLKDANSTYNEVIEAVLRARTFYKGTGTPSFYTTDRVITEMLLLKDGMGRRLYRNVDELASELRVDKIVAVEVMEDEPDLVGVIVNLSDYTVGSDKGGEVTMFDDFDIDYNQYKYLIEGRLSGALTKIRSAMVVKSVASNLVLAEPTEPGFDGTEVTIPTVTGVVYKNAVTNATINTAGSPYVLATGATLEVTAVPATGYFFATDTYDWTFKNLG